MDLWIRSQNKTKLIKIQDISINYLNQTEIISNYVNEDNYQQLGTYKTKERAIEVLNDIEKMLINNYNMNANYETCDIKIKSIIANNMLKVYDMPQE